MRILITGGTGFVGTHLIPLLLPEHEITLLVHEKYSWGHPLPKGIQGIREEVALQFADLRNFAQTKRAVDGAKAERVIHLAAVGTTDPFLPIDTALRHNLNGTLNLMRALFEKNSEPPEQLLVARTPGELTHLNLYAASKAAAWGFCQMYAQTSGWPIVGGMIFQAYGEGQSQQSLIPGAIQAAKENRDFPMSSGKQQKDWIYIGDVVAGLKRVMESELSPGESVTLGSGVSVSVAEVVELIYQLSGSSGRPLLGRLPDRSGEELIQVADRARAKEQIGWETAVSLEEGIKKMILG